MKVCKVFHIVLFGSLLLLITATATQGRVTRADYERADNLRSKVRDLVYKTQIRVRWIEGIPIFWYRNDLRDDCKEFILVDAEKGTREDAFDHKKLAEVLSKASGKEYSAEKLPFDEIEFIKDGYAVEFEVDGIRWMCDLKTYECTRARRAEGAKDRDVEEQADDRRRRRQRPEGRPPEDQPVKSPDGKWEAFVKDYNLFLRSTFTQEVYALTYDGSEDHYYSGEVSWSPDSKKLITNIVKPAEKRIVHYVESSPSDQLQPKHHTMEYEKPGDPITIRKPQLFDVETKKQIEVSDELFQNPYYGTDDWHWRPDSKAFYFYYNQRGHQVARVIEIDAETGKTRAIIDEQSDTFIDYAHKKYLQYLDDTNEIIWASERDGWSHLYLYDSQSGEVKNQITKGKWVWRRVDRVDEKKRQIWFQASGYYEGQDPYFMHYFRIDFNGTGLVALTEGNGTHSIEYSPTKAYYIDTYSRVDMPPVHELRRTSDGAVMCGLERADASELLATGWKMPEVFVSMSRDDKYEIWGMILRPTDFDESKKYPVIEDLYAGPQGSFVPKRWSDFHRSQPLAELGFIIVKMDGMGTSNRCREFHHFCAKNLGDAGLPDRIKWMKKAAEKYAYMDLSRVGVYGTSAGGQSSTGAVLTHGDFYKVAVSSCGCHDNRMDKLWWNELWMGYPVGPHYEEQSNVTNAPNLQGKLLLIVGEMDRNVDPSSTMQVVNALIKAKKDFDLLVVPGMGHSGGGQYGERRRRDFFVKHLLGEEPPDWNREEPAEPEPDVEEEQDNED